MEAVIKLVGMRSIYFYDPWNIFDFIIVLITIFSILLNRYLSINLGLSFTIVRAFRLVKLLKSTPKFKS